MRRSAFTLIELLVVVAVLTILAAIALPNFLAAHNRSLVSAAMSNQRTVALGLEAYRVDHNSYPRCRSVIPEDPLALLADRQLAPLTTPVAFITASAFRDPFGAPRVYSSLQKIPNANPGLVEPDDFLPNPRQSLLYYHYPFYAQRLMARELDQPQSAVLSIGPDQEDSLGAFSRLRPQTFLMLFSYATITHPVTTLYDPTNGSVSPGDIVRFTGEGWRR